MINNRFNVVYHLLCVSKLKNIQIKNKNMAAFPQLGYGFKSNTSHIAVEVPATEEAIMWWRHCLTPDQKADLIVKDHPNCLKQSDLMRMALWRLYERNPQKLFDKWIEENE
jgi:hypothetical protein